MSEEVASRPWWAQTPPVAVRRSWRGRVLAATLCAVVLALVIPAAAVNPEAHPRVTASGAIQQPASLSALAAGCTGVFQRPAPEPGTVGWVPLDTPYEPNFTPATEGNFARNPLSNGKSTYQLDPRRVIALLYRDWTVIWVRSNADQGEVAELASYIDGLPDGVRVAAFPWPQDEMRAWSSPAPATWAITRWGHVQYCAEFSGKVADAFVAAKRAPAPGRDLPLDESGPRATTIEGTKG